MIDPSQKVFLEHELVITQNRLANATTNADKLALLQTLISVKKLLEQAGGHYPLYQDYKRFLILYLDSLDERDFEYDEVNLDVIAGKLHSLDVERQIKLLHFLKGKLKLKGLDSLTEDCQNQIHKCELKLPVKRCSPKSYLKYVYLWSSQSSQHILFSLGVLFTVFSLLLLPAPVPLFSIINVEYKALNSNFYVNHAFNVLGLMFDLDNGLEVHPKNCVGLVLMVAGKIFYITLIANFLIKKLFSRTKIIT